MDSWKTWKAGANKCLLVGVAAGVSYAMSLVVSGLIIFIVEVIFRTTSLERHSSNLIVLLMVIITPFAAGHVDSFRTDKNSN